MDNLPRALSSVTLTLKEEAIKIGRSNGNILRENQKKIKLNVFFKRCEELNIATEKFEIRTTVSVKKTFGKKTNQEESPQIKLKTMYVRKL